MRLNCIIFTVIFAAASAVMAEQTKSITIQPSANIEISGETATVSGRISNLGNAMADNVRIVIEPPSGESFTNLLQHLDPMITKSWSCSFPVANAGDGVYQLVMRISYMDTAGKPFDTLATIPYSIGDDNHVNMTAAALTVPMTEITDPDDPEKPPRIEPEKLTDTMTLTLRIMPIGSLSEPMIFHPRILLPSSLGILGDFPPAPISVSTSTVVRTYTVTNISARTGSRLPVIMLLDSDSGDVHTSSAVFAPVNIGGDPPAGENAPAELPVERNGAIALCLFFIALAAVPWMRFFDRKIPGALADFAVLAAITVLLGSQLNIPLIFTDTTVAGGDNPAHHYLASHLAETLKTGTVASWADGWWCGFPMFRFYFPLPYVLIALMQTVIPHNIAFKLVSVLGLFILPFSAYAGGRVMRLPRPFPALLSLATVPMLFDTAHTMWGGNIYSALSGMISCSYGFAIFPAAIACAIRDSRDGCPHPHTVVLLALTALSHFFTACIAGLLLAALFAGMLISRITGNRAGIRSAAALIPVGILTFFVIAWWLLPLCSLKPWSVDFGDQWDIPFLKSLPSLIRYSFIPAFLICAGMIIVPRVKVPAGWKLFAAMHCLMFAAGVFLFFHGAGISKVFVNCRMWPFIVYSASVITALAAGAVAGFLRSGALASIGAALIVFAFAWDGENHVQDWSRYNFRGFESLPEASVVSGLADAVRGTSGRLEYDLHEGNEQLGSSRIFELMPFLCGKPVLEGGIVNSALGSMAAYSVQGRVSDNTAGFPNSVTPMTFDPADGFRRLELYGVRHFMARSPRTRDALEADQAWTPIEDFGKWRLYENPSVDGGLVRVFEHAKTIRTSDVQVEINRWLSTPHSYSKPFAIAVNEGDEPGEIEAEKTGPGWLAPLVKPVEILEQNATRIKFRTSALGKPHYIAMTYFPNWKVSGAKRVYLASSGHMIVFPEDEIVELEFRMLPVQIAGYILTFIGIAYILIWMRANRTGRYSK